MGGKSWVPVGSAEEIIAQLREAGGELQVGVRNSHAASAIIGNIFHAASTAANMLEDIEQVLGRVLDGDFERTTFKVMTAQESITAAAGRLTLLAGGSSHEHLHEAVRQSDNARRVLDENEMGGCSELEDEMRVLRNAISVALEVARGMGTKAHEVDMRLAHAGRCAEAAAHETMHYRQDVEDGKL